MPKTVLVRIDAKKIYMKYLGQELLPVLVAAAEMESEAARIQEIVTREFADVGDFSKHPVNDRMQKLIVRSDEMEWTIPAHPGV